MSDNFLKPSSVGGLSLPMQAPQQLKSGASATGNPRNKCELKPGHSLVGWIRLGNSGEDLSGTKGRVVAVTSEELAKHNTRDDAWMSLRGKVFNVTRYMDYHPGGVDELMRGVGRDATKLFDEVHAWVNFPQLLAKCYIGPLRNVEPSSPQSNSVPFFVAPPGTADTPAEITPRFDWSQTTGTLSIFIFTRQLSNPGLVLQHKTESLQLNVTVQLAEIRHLFEFELLHAVKWRPEKLRIAQEVGKIEIVLAKEEKQLWPSYGVHKVGRQASGLTEEEQLMYSFNVVDNRPLNHDSYRLSLSGCTAERDTIIVAPLGHHVSISSVVNGESLQRSYTPVDCRFLGDSMEKPSLMNSHFLLKSYPADGALSKHLATLGEHDSVLISPPKGSFPLPKLAKHRRIAFLAAGSGLTPFLNLITYLLDRSSNRIEQVLLMYFNKSEEDIWCHDYFKKLQNEDERFKLVNVLSQPASTWSGLSGRITKDLLKPLTDKDDSQMYATFVGVCGPRGFNDATQELLKDLGAYSDENLHVFQG